MVLRLSGVLSRQAVPPARGAGWAPRGGESRVATEIYCNYCHPFNRLAGCPASLSSGVQSPCRVPANTLEVSSLPPESVSSFLRNSHLPIANPASSTSARSTVRISNLGPEWARDVQIIGFDVGGVEFPAIGETYLAPCSGPEPNGELHVTGPGVRKHGQALWIQVRRRCGKVESVDILARRTTRGHRARGGSGPHVKSLSLRRGPGTLASALRAPETGTGRLSAWRSPDRLSA